MVEALHNIRPGAKWALMGYEYEGLVWEEDNTTSKPTYDELKLECDRVEIEWNNTEYQRLRKPEYPRIEDQLDMLWHAMEDGTLPKVQSFYDAIQTIKDKYPKG